ncbi:hypothetical protein [Streptomyces nitrosporeus]|uniref:hypothetical protein n=1 Tax=Streptomyces nitrosporeus TaxID=28894 RepID=UPI00167E9D5D|nr:hypothetical protein [Streptomyces nitrosporeus]GGZ19510.1 hypothetical protein GCM10010327_58250 [Streptomyces nitrosporeus]
MNSLKGSRSSLYRAYLVPVILLACVACATLQDSENRFPRAYITNEEDLVGSWRFGGSRLLLKKDGGFTASDLFAKYFDCAKVDSGGEREKSGKGVWHGRESMGTSVVFLDFSDRCYATLSVGEQQGKIVLWDDLDSGEGELMIMISATE